MSTTTSSIHRRQWLRRAGATSLAITGWAPHRAIGATPVPRERPNLLYALSTGTWGRVTPPGQPLPLLKILDETAAAGFNGVRLTGFPAILTANEISEDRLGEELARRGLKFSTVSFGGNYADTTQHNEILANLRRTLSLHQRYGATAAVFFPPGVAPPADQVRVLSECCRLFNVMGRVAREEFGIRLGLHNHTDSLVETQAQVDQFLDATDPRFVDCAWDSAHLLLGGCNVQETYRKSIDRLVYTDFKDATRSPSAADYVSPNGEKFAGDSPSGRFFNSIFELGRGEIDFVALARLLKAHQYRGWVNHDLDTVRVSCTESLRIAMDYIHTQLDPVYS